MREGILRTIFVGRNEVCQFWKEKIGSLSDVAGAERIIVETATNEHDLHQVIMKSSSMPHVIFIEIYNRAEDINLFRRLKMMLPFSEYVFVLDNTINTRMLQSIVIQSRQKGIDYFLAENSSGHTIAALLANCVEKHHLTIKALEPVKYLLQKTGRNQGEEL